mgnify:FL=1
MHASYFRLTSRLACFVQYAVHLILLGVIDCVEDAQARKPEKKIACAWYVSLLCLLGSSRKPSPSLPIHVTAASTQQKDALIVSFKAFVRSCHAARRFEVGVSSAKTADA